MKTLLLVAGGRGGSDFFQGLLDNHTEILSFPLYLRINNTLINILNEKKPEIIAKKFIDYYPEFFNSKINKFERHDRLGKKNKHFKVSKKKFKFNLIKFYKNKKITRFEKLKIIHLAYSAAKGENLKKKKFY